MTTIYLRPEEQRKRHGHQEEAPEEALEEALEEAQEEAPEEAQEEAPEEALEEAPEEALEEAQEEALEDARHRSTKICSNPKFNKGQLCLQYYMSIKSLIFRD